MRSMFPGAGVPTPPTSQHVVVEGPDGGGKTSLVSKLATRLSLPIHTRASTSLGGPVPQVDEWAIRDLRTMNRQPSSVYDRHPAISEPIYGPLVRGKAMGQLSNGEMVSRLRTRLMARAFVVWCLPPFGVVQKNVSADRDMPGVVAHLPGIYLAYERLAARWKVNSFLYDYTRPNEVDRLLAILKGRIKNDQSD